MVDLWHDRSGHLFGRFSSSGYTFHAEIRIGTGGPVVGRRDDSLVSALADILLLWLDEGVDEHPSWVESPVLLRDETR